MLDSVTRMKEKEGWLGIVVNTGRGMGEKERLQRCGTAFSGLGMSS